MNLCVEQAPLTLVSKKSYVWNHFDTVEAYKHVCKEREISSKTMCGIFMDFFYVEGSVYRFSKLCVLTAISFARLSFHSHVQGHYQGSKVSLSGLWGHLLHIVIFLVESYNELSTAPLNSNDDRKYKTLYGDASEI